MHIPRAYDIGNFRYMVSIILFTGIEDGIAWALLQHTRAQFAPRDFSFTGR